MQVTVYKMQNKQIWTMLTNSEDYVNPPTYEVAKADSLGQKKLMILADASMLC